MYTHISMFRLRDREKLAVHRNLIREKLLTFPAHIPYIAGYRVLDNCLAQPNVPEGSPLLFCDLIQIVTFRSAGDLAAYPHDPYHMAMVKETDGIMERVCILDFKNQEEA